MVLRFIVTDIYLYDCRNIKATLWDSAEPDNQMNVTKNMTRMSISDLLAKVFLKLSLEDWSYYVAITLVSRFPCLSCRQGFACPVIKLSQPLSFLSDFYV
jgi:hypothetical protein